MKNGFAAGMKRQLTFLVYCLVMKTFETTLILLVLIFGSSLGKIN